MAISPPPPSTRAEVLALLGLTLVTGLIDAASVLGPGHVFTANMTGNVVFLGFAIGSKGASELGYGLLALGSFLIGAAAGGRLTKVVNARSLRRGMAIEIALIALAGIGATSSRTGPVIACLALAMGMRNAIARRLAVADLTTTVLTLTLTGLAADSTLAGGTNPRWARRIGAAACMLAGALAGAWMLPYGWQWVIAVAVVVEIASVAALVVAAERPAAKATGA